MLALIIPYAPLGGVFKFVRPPAPFFVFLAAILGTYIALAEVIKRWLYRDTGISCIIALGMPKVDIPGYGYLLEAWCSRKPLNRE